MCFSHLVMPSYFWAKRNLWDIKAPLHLLGKQGQCIDECWRIMKGTLVYLGLSYSVLGPCSRNHSSVVIPTIMPYSKHSYKTEEAPFTLAFLCEVMWPFPIFGSNPRGHSTLGYVPCATKKTLLFLLTFTERPPFLPTFNQWPPIFNKLLVTRRPWHIFVTQRPLIFTFNSQTSDNFGQKIWFFKKFWQIWRNVEKFLAILALKAPIFLCISLKDPLFLWALSLKDPLFWCNLSPKDPTSEVLGGTRTSLSYVSAPPWF